jgi:hypothetical protein
MRRHLIVPVFLALVLAANHAGAQQILDQSIQIEITQQPLGKTLEIIGAKGHFTFTYNSAILNKDSIVSLPAQSTTIRNILNQLFNGRLFYQQDGRYLILLPAEQPKIFPPIPTKHQLINGVILDERTGETIADASIYDAGQLNATLSKPDGSFVIKIKNRTGSLTISKEFYLDTTIRLPPAAEKITILLSREFEARPATVSPQPTPPDTINITLHTDSAQLKAVLQKDLIQVEMTGFGRILLSSRLKMQSLNLKKLFIQRPIQLSLVPGLSSNGALNSQVTNKFSVNVVGGYEAGLEGVELAGVFNIDKRKMYGVQAAGAVNLAGDSVGGVQLAGIYNRVLDSMNGVQAAGAINVARNSIGVQLAGAANISHNVTGAQLAGGVNLASNVKGLQLGAVNIASHVSGAQYGEVNIARHVKGFQLGVINIDDTLDGAAVGLLTIVKHGGLHQLSFFSDEFAPLNIAFRLGNKNLYSIFQFGINPTIDRRSYNLGYGLGHRFPLSASLGLDLEFISSNIAPVAWKNFGDNNWVQRMNLDLHWRINSWLSLSGGPSVAFYTHEKDYTINGHVYKPVGYSTFTIRQTNLGWVGWHAAINFL